MPTISARSDRIVVLFSSLAGLAVVDTARRAIDQEHVFHKTWPEIVLLLFSMAIVGIVAALVSQSGRLKLGDSFQGNQVRWVLISLSESPVMVAVAMLFLGAAVWTAWVALVGAFLLLAASFRFA